MNRQRTSTSRIGFDLDRMVQAFEQAVVAQRSVPPERYDDDYFASDWRAAGNRYDLETRRRVEARNPQLIAEVFRPSRTLDVGCGPGFLIYLLSELDLEVDGVDFSPRSKVLAPPQVRDRITVADVSRMPVESQSYELVICRELMEHLTVLQIRRTVAEVCRASSRYVYMTTRFHPAPASLLDFTTQFEVDPTHITLLTKELLRCLLVLEGFVRRADLEERMDWARKGRVLVYERAAE